METPQQPSLHETTIKDLSHSATVSTIPSLYASQNPEAAAAEPIDEEEIPSIDFSLLTGGTSEQRSQVVRDLHRACQEWGAFMIVNHSVAESLRAAVLAAVEGFFDLTEEEKREYAVGKDVLASIQCGTSFCSDVRRDHLKVTVHPEFHSPAKPTCFREILQEYTSYTRQMARELLNGIWEGLELESNSMDNDLELDSCHFLFAANLYPPCTQPAGPSNIGLPAHSDYGLLTLLIENGINGLQVKHSGKWIDVKPLPNSFFVNTGDHMEIVSNGRFKGAVHRAIVNRESARVSVVTSIGPSLETVVVPNPQLVYKGGRPSGYRGMKYKDYLKYTLENRKTALDFIKLPRE